MQSTQSPSAVAPAPDARTQAMLRGPIGPTLLRFAAPTVLVVTIQALVSIMETYFVGILGTDALAGSRGPRLRSEPRPPNLSARPSRSHRDCGSALSATQRT
jgi:hypothetical protein